MTELFEPTSLNLQPGGGGLESVRNTFEAIDGVLEPLCLAKGYGLAKVCRDVTCQLPCYRQREVIVPSTMPTVRGVMLVSSRTQVRLGPFFLY
ncbi:MAG: hypothetical protein WAM42_13150 [Candidatus Nitrosopolaris sp.]